MIFSREITAASTFLGGDTISCMTPSMRNRMRNTFSYGSQCRSEAPRLIASSITLFTNLTTGAPSAASRSSTTSPVDRESSSETTSTVASVSSERTSSIPEVITGFA